MWRQFCAQDPDIRQLATGSVVAKMRVAHRTPQKLTE